MGSSGVRSALHRLKARVMDHLVQDCPPDVAACEVCGQLQCTSEEWLKCERRLAAARYLKAGNGAEVERLKAIHEREATDHESKRPRCGTCRLDDTQVA